MSTRIHPEEISTRIHPDIIHWTIYSATTFLEKCRKVVQEIWFEKSGSRNMVGEKWLIRKKGGFIPYIHIFSGWRKVVDQKKNPSLQNHFAK